jgi:hypothetical protein
VVKRVQATTEIPRSNSKMSSKTISKLMKEADALLKTSDEGTNPLLVTILKLVNETLRVVSAGSAETKGKGKSKKDDDAPTSDGEAKPKRKASAWASWVKDVKLAHPDAYESYKTAHPEMKSHVIAFAKAWKDDHADEYNAYVSAHSPAGSDVEAKPKPKAEAKAKAEPKPKKAPAKPKAKKPAGGAGAPMSDSDSSDSD